MNSLAWPAAVLLDVALVGRELIGVFSVWTVSSSPAAKVTFATLAELEKVVAVAAEDAGAADDGEVVRYEMTEFSIVEALASVAPRQAVIDACGLLEYQLNVASDRFAPDQSRGWPQVARNLEAWDKWPLLYPAAMELRRLRDYTVVASRPPSSADATRYVSVAQDLATAIRTSLISDATKSSGVGG